MSTRNGGESTHEERLAPVTPLFAAHESAGGRMPDAQWHRSWITEPSPADQAGIVSDADAEEHDADAGGGIADAEKLLLRKLRSRSLSEREARQLLVAQEVPTERADDLIATFLRRGYIDDERLAEQLVHAATSRKAQGRQAIVRTLLARGIPSDVVDATLAGLPDDEEERALEFARQKARSMASLDRDTALRRLHGQLARRGFGGATAMTAARQALDEASTPATRVRFT